MKIKNKGFTLIELMIVIAIIAIIAAIAIPNLIEARKSGNESSAIGSLKAMATAQAMYSQQDKDGVNGQNYAHDLTELGSASAGSLIDGTIAAGQKSGYVLDMSAPAAPNDQGNWNAVAFPLTPGSTGDRYFFSNQSGQIFYTGQAGSAFTPAPGTLTGTDLPDASWVVLGK